MRPLEVPTRTRAWRCARARSVPSRATTNDRSEPRRERTGGGVLDRRYRRNVLQRGIAKGQSHRQSRQARYAFGHSSRGTTAAH